jgi:hypothetical protein
LGRGQLVLEVAREPGNRRVFEDFRELELTREDLLDALMDFDELERICADLE